ncbi:hypothetical protein TWF225_001642 [Orbilia oligospora]|nr:hypothetical protein TWF225_001642 [Orbilia oligospora]KAF3171872.1 hypothetical protein TWF751_006174 [Orbilia oligospora]KAF3245698.1 hypothetical protein TWF128_009397 [Orbilia oligospora]KAF3257262.1 hypothetical protein TWF217_006010 [Orbilia oligospora]KAF3276014.1 hypothetical protein TWF132_002533 [Orbilia oligospora]
MATTPPPRSPIECPGAPLWPAKYEQPHEVRRSGRLASQKPKGEPSTPRRDQRITPPPTAKKDKSVGRSLSGANAPQTPLKKKAVMPVTPVSVAKKSAKAASLISKFSLDQRSDNPIAIFEDSNARLPEAIGEDEDDVFKGDEKETKPSKVAPVEEFTEPNEEGMMVVQRGRRTWKKFEENPIFTGPLPRKNLFANYPKVSKKKAQAPMPEDTLAPLATDDEETEREDSPEPSGRIVRFEETKTKVSTSVSTSVTTTSVTTSRAIATPVSVKKPKTPRHVKKDVTIDTAFMTPPETLGRVHTIDVDAAESAGRNTVKRKLSYATTGPATPEATPAKKRGKAASGASVPRTDDPFASSPTRARRSSGKPRV